MSPLAADKNYDTKYFVNTLRRLRVTPHVAQNDTNRSSAIDERTTRHAGYEVSQRKRKLVEQIFPMAEDHLFDAQGTASRHRAYRVDVHPGAGCVQFGSLD